MRVQLEAQLAGYEPRYHLVASVTVTFRQCHDGEGTIT
jgi:hypothetical protein